MKQFMGWLLSLLLCSSALASDKPILILWISYGKGHETAAKAIEQQIHKLDPEKRVVLKDVKDFLPKSLQASSTQWYEYLTRNLPEVYDVLYRNHLRLGSGKHVTPYLALMQAFRLREIAAWINALGPSVVVSTSNTAAEILAALDHRQMLNPVAKAWQHTDYVPAAYYANLSQNLDMTFLPHRDMTQFWIENGIRYSRVMTTGMSMDSAIYEPVKPADLDAFATLHGLDRNIPIITLMGGSNGVGNFTTQIESITQLGRPVQVVALTGNNQAQRDTIAEWKKAGLPRELKNLVVMPTVTRGEVFNFLRLSSAFVTKSGGLTPTEAVLLQVPLILLDINGGQERFNAEFFARHRIALVTEDQEEVGALVGRILNSPELAAEMQQHQKEFGGFFKPEAIARWAIERANKARLTLRNKKAKSCRADLRESEETWDRQ